MITVAAVRQRVATAISTALLASGWREGTGVYDTFGAVDGENRLHKGYAVGTPSSTPTGDRQRISLGSMVETSVRVAWAYQMAALDQVSSYDAALAAEASIVAAIMVKQQSTDLHLTFTGANRRVDDQGWMFGDLAFIALHSYALA